MHSIDLLLKSKSFSDIIRKQILSAITELKQSKHFLSNEDIPNHKEMAIFYLGEASNKLTLAETIYSLDAFTKQAFLRYNMLDMFEELRIIIDEFIKALTENYPIDDLSISKFEKKLSTCEFFSLKE